MKKRLVEEVFKADSSFRIVANKVNQRRDRVIPFRKKLLIIHFYIIYTLLRTLNNTTENIHDELQYLQLQHGFYHNSTVVNSISPVSPLLMSLETIADCVL